MKRSREEIEAYKERLEAHYISDKKVMSDIELHNAQVRIDRAIAFYSIGKTFEEIRVLMKKVEDDPEMSIPMDDMDKVQDKIQKHLIAKGIEKDSVEFKKKELKLLEKWAKTLQ